jgi:YbgC/YbaW family acyl-CoA thioester hydrolase
MSTPFTFMRRVQFAETDMAGVLHFANYFRLMEEAEHAFWRSLGLSVVGTGHERRVTWPRVAAHCEYLAPARFEDELQLELRLLKIGRRALNFETVFRRGQEIIAKGHFTTACCELTGGSFKAVAIPAEVREALEKHA